MKAQKGKVAECARRGCASPRECVMREGHPTGGRRRMRKARREGNEKEEGDEKNKEQVEKKSPCFCFSIRKIEK